MNAPLSFVEQIYTAPELFAMLTVAGAFITFILGFLVKLVWDRQRELYVFHDDLKDKISSLETEVKSEYVRYEQLEKIESSIKEEFHKTMQPFISSLADIQRFLREKK